VLDTGVNRDHPLLEDVLADADATTVDRSTSYSRWRAPQLSCGAKDTCDTLMVGAIVPCPDIEFTSQNLCYVNWSLYLPVIKVDSATAFRQ